MTELELTREQILHFRRHVSALDERLPPGPESLRQAAWAGLQDSVPRAAVLSIHARVQDTEPETWDGPSLEQIWGPRFSVYVVAARDVAPFTLGRSPGNTSGKQRAEDLATRLAGLLGDGSMTYREAGKALGVPPNSLRFATTTGTVRIRWEGSGSPTIRTVPPPDIDPHDARLELARRYLHVFGPSTAEAFAVWAGVGPKSGLATFESLRSELTHVRTPVGDGWILAADEERLLAALPPPVSVRLLPSGDTYYLLQGDQRELLVPDGGRRSRLWTPRVWPGAVLVNGVVAGIWRRAGNAFTFEMWDRLDPMTREAIEEEARSLPLHDLQSGCVIEWVE